MRAILYENAGLCAFFIGQNKNLARERYQRINLGNYSPIEPQKTSNCNQPLVTLAINPLFLTRAAVLR